AVEHLTRENSTDSSESAVVADLDSCQLCNSLGALQQLHWGERGGGRQQETMAALTASATDNHALKVVTRQHCVSSVSVLFAFAARSLDLTCPGCLREALLFASGPSLEFVGYL
ncbi:hypothetical protein JOQ06_015736, partial [Pogonophryne albipinna]